MIQKFKKFIILVVVFVLLLTATGCGANNEPAAGTRTFTLGTSAAFDTLNPLSSYMQVTYEFFALVYDSLTTYDENLNPAPALAKSWTVSDDNLTWTFKLQEGVKWHDGQPFTSKDVKFTYDLMINTGLGYMYNSYLTGITDVQCPDDLTVVITVDAPKANMLMNTTPILPEHIFSQVAEEELEAWPNSTPIGTGAFKFDSADTGFVKIVKNPDYFGTQPTINEFIFVPYENTDSMAQALMLGELDGATSLNPSQLKQLQEDKNISVISGESRGFTQIGVNVWEDPASGGNPLLKEKVIRQAIELSLNKQKIVDMAYNGQGLIGTTLVNPGDFYHYEPTDTESRAYNADKAKDLLKSAGYTDTNSDGVLETSDGTPLEFTLISISDNLNEVKAAQLIAADCAAVGIKINNETMDSGALQDRINAGTFDLFIWGWGADVDPTIILGLLTTDQIGGNNEPHWSNAQYDELYLAQQAEMDQAARKAMVQQMQQIAYDEAPYILLVYDNNIQAIRTDRWTGFKAIPESGLYFFNLTNYNYINMKPVK